jgi:hypothetical protein
MRASPRLSKPVAISTTITEDNGAGRNGASAGTTAPAPAP